uniref:NEDD4 binding protein 2 n=1 Tax=Oncorhynchus kisutch TaxID=8019 RepID=A0A8C7KMX1_ONCKI
MTQHDPLITTPNYPPNRTQAHPTRRPNYPPNRTQAHPIRRPNYPPNRTQAHPTRRPNYLPNRTQAHPTRRPNYPPNRTQAHPIRRPNYPPIRRPNYPPIRRPNYPPPQEAKLPSHQEASPPHQEASPLHQEASPLHQEASPPHQEASPLHQEASPLHQEASPPHQEASPPHQEASPPHQEASPPHQEASPPHQEASPPHQEASPSQPKSSDEARHDLVGEQRLVQGSERSCPQLSSSLPDVSSVGRSGRAITPGHSSAHGSTESLSLIGKASEKCGILDNSKILDEEDILDLGAVASEPEAPWQPEDEGKMGEEEEETGIPHCLVESVFSADFHGDDERPVAFSESIGQRVRKERRSRTRKTDSDRLEPAVIVKDASQSVSEGDGGGKLLGEMGDGGEQVGDGGERVRPELLEFVGDWPSEEVLEQRRGGGGRNGRHPGREEEGEEADPRDSQSEGHPGREPHVTEFQKLLELLQTGVDSFPLPTCPSPIPSLSSDRSLGEGGERGVAGGRRGEADKDRVLSREELPDCVSANPNSTQVVGSNTVEQREGETIQSAGEGGTQGLVEKDLLEVEGSHLGKVSQCTDRDSHIGEGSVEAGEGSHAGEVSQCTDASETRVEGEVGHLGGGSQCTDRDSHIGEGSVEAGEGSHVGEVSQCTDASETRMEGEVGHLGGGSQCTDSSETRMEGEVGHLGGGSEEQRQSRRAEKQLVLTFTNNTPPSPKPQTDADLDPNPNSDLDPNLHSDLDPNPNSDLDPNPNSDLDPNLHSDLDPNPNSDLAPNLHSDLAPNLHSDLDPNLPSDLDPNIHSDLDPNLHSDLDPNLDSDFSPNFDLNPNLDPNLDSDLNPNLDPDLQPNLDPVLNPNLDLKPNLQPDLYPNLNPDLNPNPHRPSPPPSLADTDRSSQTDPQDFAFLWRLDHNRHDNPTDAAGYHFPPNNTLAILHGNPSRFLPEVSAAVSAGVAVHPSGQRVVPYRVTHEKGSQVEERELEEGRTRLQNLVILRRHFKLVNRHTLEDLYDTCQQDLEWTSNLLLDSGERLFLEEEEDEEGDEDLDMAVGVSLEERTERRVTPPGEQASANSGSDSEAVVVLGRGEEEEETWRTGGGVDEGVGGVSGLNHPVSGGGGGSEEQNTPLGESTRLEHRPPGRDVEEQAVVRDSESGADAEQWEKWEREEELYCVDEVTQSLLAQLEEMERREEEEERKGRKEKRRDRLVDIQSVELKLPTELALQLVELFGPVGVLQVTHTHTHNTTHTHH